MSVADNELVGCPEPAVVVLSMMCRRITFALACNSGKLSRAHGCSSSWAGAALSSSYAYAVELTQTYKPDAQAKGFG